MLKVRGGSSASAHFFFARLRQKRGLIARLGAWAAASLVAFWAVLWQVFGDSLPRMGYLNALGFFWGLIAAIASALLISQRRWITGLGFGALACAILATGFSFGSRAASAAERTVRVVSASLRTMNTDMSDAADKLLATEAQILILQEVFSPRDLHRELQQRSGVTWYAAQTTHVMVASRFPLSALEQEEEPLKTSVLLPGGRRWSIWSLRAPKDYADIIDSGVYTRQLVDKIASERPDIVAGDFNATPWNERYRAMSRHMKSSFDEAGFGFGFTFPTPARRSGALSGFLRLDYVFVRPDVAVAAAKVGHASRGADHFPVIVDLVLPR